ncbi:MAG: hypothetical protein JWN48_5894 [Myxococcaceae bacterium]|nr:hypothetical protein [Myxococcaceae bacterium]
MAYDNFLIDKRVVERNIKKGLVEEDALKKQIEALPDRESNLVHVSLEGRAEDAPEDSLDDAEDDDEEDDDEEDDDEEDDAPEA